MATEIPVRNMPASTLVRFHGGDAAGRCYQLTVGDTYLVFREASAAALAWSILQDVVSNLITGTET